jgi:hypothetical protein
MAQNYLKLYARLARARSVPTLTSVAEGDEFLPASLVTCRHAPNPAAPRDNPASAIADPGLGILQ